MNIEKLAQLVADLPEPYKANAQALVERMGAVIEGIGDEGVKWRTPTAKLMQATSDRSKLPRGATIGDIIVGERILQKPARFIPIKTWDSRQYWSPDKDEEKMLCSSPDAKVGYIGANCATCKHAVFDETTNKTECNKVKSFIVILEDLSDIFIMNFGKTSYKIGLAYEKNLKKAGVMPYRRVYGLSSVSNKQYKNVENLDIELYDGDKRDTPAVLLPFVEELFKQVKFDREEMLIAFHKMVTERRQDPSLLTGSNSDSELVMLEDGSDEASSPPVGIEAAPAKSSMAKKYVV